MYATHNLSYFSENENVCIAASKTARTVAKFAGQDIGLWIFSKMVGVTSSSIRSGRCSASDSSSKRCDAVVAKPTFAEAPRDRHITNSFGPGCRCRGVAEEGRAQSAVCPETIIWRPGRARGAVATGQFRTAARAQAAALNRPGLTAVYVPHPIHRR